jgi:hypothetical protein
MTMPAALAISWCRAAVYSASNKSISFNTGRDACVSREQKWSRISQPATPTSAVEHHLETVSPTELDLKYSLNGVLRTISLNLLFGIQNKFIMCPKNGVF